MSAPLIFVRDGRTLPFIPVTTAALAAIREHVKRGRPYATATYIALLELANEERTDRVAVSQREIVERVGAGRTTVQAALGDLEAAGVLVVNARVHATGRLENEYVVVEPDATNPTPSPATRAGVARQASRPRPPHGQRTQEGVEEKEEVVDPVKDLFAYWQTRCEHPDAKFSSDRRTKIAARLKDGYTDEQIRLAINGAALAPTIGDNGVVHDDIELICRSGAKLDSFIARAKAKAKTNGHHRTTTLAGLRL